MKAFSVDPILIPFLNRFRGRLILPSTAERGPPGSGNDNLNWEASHRPQAQSLSRDNMTSGAY
jgi:hypothetical protein